MALEIFLETLEGVPETLQPHYVKQDDGTFILEVVAAKGYELRNTTGIKSALEKERSNASEYKRKLTAFGEHTPEQIADNIRQLEELRGAIPEDQLKSMIEEEKKKLQIQYADAIEAEKKKGANYYNQYKREKLQTTALSALEKHGGRVEVMLPHILDNLQFRESEEGKFMVEVLGSDGQVRSGADLVTPMSVEELVVEYSKKEGFKQNFDSSGASGGGAAGGGQGGRMKGDPTKGMTPQQKLAYAHDHPEA